MPRHALETAAAAALLMNRVLCSTMTIDIEYLVWCTQSQTQSKHLLDDLLHYPRSIKLIVFSSIFSVVYSRGQRCRGPFLYS